MSEKIIEKIRNGNCNDEYYQSFLAGIHSIDEWDFKSWTRNFDPALTKGRVYKAGDIAKWIKVDCEAFIVDVGFDGDWPGKPGTNQDIEFKVVPPFTVNYSIALFKGILKLFAPDEFHFFKAEKGKDTYDIIFKALKGGATVYIGDLSGLP